MAKSRRSKQQKFSHLCVEQEKEEFYENAVINEGVSTTPAQLRKAYTPFLNWHRRREWKTGQSLKAYSSVNYRILLQVSQSSWIFLGGWNICCGGCPHKKGMGSDKWRCYQAASWLLDYRNPYTSNLTPLSLLLFRESLLPRTWKTTYY